MNRAEEMAVKADRLRAWMSQNDYAGVMLNSRANFAWLTGGGLSYIDASSEQGVGAMLVTADAVSLVANNIEARRFVEEELVGLDVKVIEFPWYTEEGERDAVAKVIGGGRLATDSGGAGEAIKALRTPLLGVEIERYRALGRMSTQLTEGICREIRAGMSEDDVVAMTQERFARQGIRVPVYLVAADERIDLRRHPISKGRSIERRVMVVVCAEANGLWVNLTRLVNFERIGGELELKHRAVCEIDATANAATRPGRTLGEVFADIVSAYESQGFADEWKFHHQGGSTGYNGRDVFGNPTAEAIVQADQAYAWNPSITGTKCEDTMLVTDDGFEWITEPGDDWPVVEVEREGRVLRRAGIYDAS